MSGAARSSRAAVFVAGAARIALFFPAAAMVACGPGSGASPNDLGDWYSPDFPDAGKVVPAQISAGAAHTCARMSNGTVRCWGDGTSGQLAGSDRFESIPDLTSVVSIASGLWHTCALVQTMTDPGSVWCWGLNDHGQLGVPTLDVGGAAQSVVPLRAEALPQGKIVKLVAGPHATCAFYDGEPAPRCVGATGLGCNKVPDFEGIGADGGTPAIKDMAFSGFQIALVFADGTVAWDNGGNNVCEPKYNDQTNGGGTAKFGTDAVRAAAGRGFDLWLLSDGTIRGWGSTAQCRTADGYHPWESPDCAPSGLPWDGSLPFPPGTGCTNQKPDTLPWSCPPAPVDEKWFSDSLGKLGKVTDIQAGKGERVSLDFFGWACAIVGGGQVACWGGDKDGEQATGAPAGTVGNDDLQKPIVEPSVIPGITDAVELTLGATHACVRSSSNEVRCWGKKDPTFPSARLGDPSQESGVAPGSPIVFNPP